MTIFTQATQDWAGLISGSGNQPIESLRDIYVRYVFFGQDYFTLWDKEFRLDEFVNHDVSVPLDRWTPLFPALAFRRYSLVDLRWVTVGLALDWKRHVHHNAYFVDPNSLVPRFYRYVVRFLSTEGPTVMSLKTKSPVFRLCNFPLYVGSDLKKPGWQGLFPSQPLKYFSEVVGRLNKASYRSPRGGLPRTSTGWSTRASSRPNPEVIVSKLRSTSIGMWDTFATYQTYSFDSLNRSFSSVRTPGFRFLKKRKLPDNPYSLDVRKVSQTQCAVLGSWIEGPYGPNGRIILGGTSQLAVLQLPSAPVFDITVKNRAQRKLADRAGLESSSIPQDIVQFRQMQKLIGSNFFSLANSYRALKRGDINSAVDHLLSKNPQRAKGGVVRHGNMKMYIEGRFIKTRNGNILKLRDKQSIETLSSASGSLANKWLELQYGWKPLLMDIHTVLQATANYVVNSEVEKRIKVSAQNDKIQEAEYAGYGFGLVAADTSVKNIKTVTSTYSRSNIVLRYKLADRFKSFLSQTGFTSPVSLAWEILPWSFVVDWALPIGPYLQSFSDFEGMEFKGGSQTDFVRQTYVAAVDAHYSRAPYSGYTALNFDMTGSYSREWVKMSRVKLISFPTQTFPPLKNPMSMEHALNGLALLRTVFGRKTGN